MPPFSPPGLLLHKEPKGIWLHSSVWSPNPHHRVFITPWSSHDRAGLWPRVTCQREDGTNAFQWMVAWGANEWEAYMKCVYGMKNKLVSWCFSVFFHAHGEVDIYAVCLCVNMKETGCVILWGRLSAFWGESVWPAGLSLVTKCKSPLEITFAHKSQRWTGP